MRMAMTAFAAAALGFSPPDSAARPVTYPGGTMIMSDHFDGTTTVDLARTLTPRLALGLRGSWDDDAQDETMGLIASALLARRNAPNSQANLFATLGAFAGEDSRGADTPGLSASLEADWETRRYYLQGRVSAVDVDDDADAAWRARAGVAPYVADAGALHAWLILQLDHDPEDAQGVQVTPVLRLFRGPFLAEAGATIEGGAHAALWFYF